MKPVLITLLVLVGLTVGGHAQATLVLGLTSLLPVELSVAARDLAEVGEEVIARQNRCVDRNGFGAFAEGGGCNRFGCWPAGGSCNAFGCSLTSVCTEEGCSAKIEPFVCELPPPAGI